jgi:hypothetical protein
MMRVEYKKAPDWPREVRYAARSGAEVTKLGMGGDQARDIGLGHFVKTSTKSGPAYNEKLV